MSDTEIGTLRAMLLSRPRPAGLAERRQRLDALGAAYALAPDVTVRPVDANGVPAEWTSTPAADVSRVILFLHGGGYVSGSIASHRHLVAEAGRAAGARTLALDYRRAPEHPFPAAVDDAMAGYRFLLSTGVAPSRVCIAGDSAGGGMTLAALVTIRDAGMKPPGCAWCISPWVDLECIGASMASKAAADPMIQRDYLREIGGITQWRRPAFAARRAAPCGARGAATDAHSGWHGGDLAGRRGAPGRPRGGGGRPGHARDVARDDPCVAPVPPATRRGAAGDTAAGGLSAPPCRSGHQWRR